MRFLASETDSSVFQSLDQPRKDVLSTRMPQVRQRHFGRLGVKIGHGIPA